MMGITSQAPKYSGVRAAKSHLSYSDGMPLPAVVADGFGVGADMPKRYILLVERNRRVQAGCWLRRIGAIEIAKDLISINSIAAATTLHRTRSTGAKSRRSASPTSWPSSSPSIRSCRRPSNSEPSFPASFSSSRVTGKGASTSSERGRYERSIPRRPVAK